MSEQSPVVAIVGATGALGGAIARRLVMAGRPVVLGSRDPDKSRAAATALAAETGREVGSGSNAEAAAAGDDRHRHGAVRRAARDARRDRVVRPRQDRGRHDGAAGAAQGHARPVAARGFCRGHCPGRARTGRESRLRIPQRRGPQARYRPAGRVRRARVRRRQGSARGGDRHRRAVRLARPARRRARELERGRGADLRPDLPEQDLRRRRRRRPDHRHARAARAGAEPR